MLDDFDRSANRASKSGATMERVANDIRRALLALGLAFSVREVIQYADSWNLVESRLKLVTTSSQQLVAVQYELFDIAQRSRSSFEGVADLYTRIARNANGLGMTQREILRITENVNKSFQLSGASTMEMEAGVRQLGQAFARGVLKGDEFIAMSENADDLMKRLTETLGVTKGELIRMAGAGELTSELLADAILKMTESIDEDFAGIQVTIGQSFMVLRNEIMRFIGETDNATGVSRAFANMIILIAKNLDTIATTIGVATAAWVGYRTALITIATWQTVVAGKRAIEGFLNLAKAIGLVNAASQAFSKGTVVGRLVTIAMTVGGAAAAWFGFNKLQEEAEQAALDTAAGMGTLDEVIGGLRQNVDELTDAEKEWLELRKKTLQSNQDMIITATQELSLARLRGAAQERLRIDFEAQNKVLQAKRDLEGDLLENTLAYIEAERQLKIETLNVNQAMDAATVAMEKNLAIVKEFKDNLQRSFGDVFYKILEDGISSFTDLFNGIKSMFFRMLADMAAAQMMKKVGGALASILAGSFGGMTPTGTTPIGTPDEYGAIAVKIEGVASTVTESFAAKIGAALGVAGVGFGVGQMVGGLTTNRGLGALGGAAAGAAAGAALGSVVPIVGTAIGAVVGGMAGLVGGFFGASKAAKELEARLKAVQAAAQGFVNDMRVQELIVAGKKEEAEIQQLINRQAEEYHRAQTELMLSEEQLARLRELHNAQLNELTKAHEEAAAAAAKQAEEERRRTEELKRQSQENLALRALGAVGIDTREAELAARHRREIQAAMDSGATAEEVAAIKGVQYLERLALEAQMAREARALEVAKLEEKLDALYTAADEQVRLIEEAAREEDVRLAKQAEDARKEAERVEALLRDQLDVANEAYQIARDEHTDARNRLAETTRVMSTLRDYLGNLALDRNRTILSPEAILAEAQKKFQETADLALGGDQRAAQELPEAADALLDAAREMFASSPAYASAYRQVEDVMQRVAAYNGAILTEQEKMLENAEQQLTAAEATVANISALIDQNRVDANAQLEEIEALRTQNAEKADAQVAAIRDQMELDEALIRDQIAVIEATVSNAERELAARADEYRELYDKVTTEHTDQFNQMIHWLQEIYDRLGAGGGGGSGQTYPGEPPPPPEEEGPRPPYTPRNPSGPGNDPNDPRQEPPGGVGSTPFQNRASDRINREGFNLIASKLTETNQKLSLLEGEFRKLRG